MINEKGEPSLKKIRAKPQPAGLAQLEEAALNALATEGYHPSLDQVAVLSPYQTRHIKRFGNYEIDFSAVPALIADDLTFTLEPPPDPIVVEATPEE